MSSTNKPLKRRRNARPTCTASPSHQRGQAYAEYVVIVLLVVVVLIAGNNPVIAQLLAAIKSFYSAYSFSLSMP